ncbi:diguanylate cyclase [Oscillospiraceae bacterium MB08-C2-2]|nr:diguanylate cyclase [Oscillospiraceae bacterium MB08-C2-2]
MNNFVVASIYTPFLVVNIMMIVLGFRRDLGQYVIRRYIFLSISLAAWQICELLIFLLPDAFFILYFYHLKAGLTAFTAYNTFFLVLGFYRLMQRVPSWLSTVLAIPPGIAVFLALLSPLGPFFDTAVTIRQMEPLRILEHAPNVWLYFYMIYCYALVFACAVLIFLRHRQLPAAYRGSSNILLMGSGVFFICLFLRYIPILTIPFNLIILGFSVSTIFIYVATMGPRSDYMKITRSEIFNCLEELIFILNVDKRVLDANLMARKWAEAWGIPLEATLFEDILSQLENAGHLSRRPAEDGVDLIFSEGSRPTVYCMNEQSITSETGALLGSYITLTDVTRNRLVIDWLREIAGTDTLTGLPNRRSYQHMRDELDIPENLPLGVVVGDANGLKEVNDTLGHQEGDAFLKAIAQVLQDICPPEGRIARVGGDEFVLLLPRHNRQQLRILIDSIAQELNELEVGNFVPSIAFGFVVKTAPEQSLETLVRLADRNMYRTKGIDEAKMPPSVAEI